MDIPLLESMTEADNEQQVRDDFERPAKSNAWRGFNRWMEPWYQMGIMGMPAQVGRRDSYQSGKKLTAFHPCHSVCEIQSVTLVQWRHSASNVITRQGNSWLMFDGFTTMSPLKYTKGANSVKHSEFHIGLDFCSSGGFPYRCTDVGQRTITAICLDKTSGQWYAGPPYPVEEKLFDELKIKGCFLDEVDAIKEAIAESEKGFHPGYPSSAMRRFMKARTDADYLAYPNKPLLRLNKVMDGEILHPYSVIKRGEFWGVLCYLPFEEEYQELDEYFFLSLPLATEDDYRQRKACKD